MTSTHASVTCMHTIHMCYTETMRLLIANCFSKIIVSLVLQVKQQFHGFWSDSYNKHYKS